MSVLSAKCGHRGRRSPEPTGGPRGKLRVGHRGLREARACGFRSSGRGRSRPWGPVATWTLSSHIHLVYAVPFRKHVSIDVFAYNLGSAAPPRYLSTVLPSSNPTRSSNGTGRNVTTLSTPTGYHDLSISVKEHGTMQELPTPVSTFLMLPSLSAMGSSGTIPTASSFPPLPI